MTTTWAGVLTILRQRRKDLGLSQRELADKVSCAQSVISDWESGKVMPQLDSVIAWCNALEIDLDLNLQLRRVEIPARSVRFTMTQENP